MTERAIAMKVTFDSSVNAAYIYFDGHIAPGAAVRMVPVDPVDVDGMVNIDLDGEGRLLGIEILDATRLLPSGLIDQLIT